MTEPLITIPLAQYDSLCAARKDARLEVIAAEARATDAWRDRETWMARNDLLVKENAALHTRLRELGHPYDFGGPEPPS